eukprot:gene11710-biopygen11775
MRFTDWNTSCGVAFSFMYAGAVTSLFFLSKHVASMSHSFSSFPNDSAASIDPWYGHASPLQPKVRVKPGPPDLRPKTLAATMGAMQQRPRGFLAAWNSFRTASTAGSTAMSAPLKPKSEKFFATPNPPGMNSASWSAAFSFEMSTIAPRAIRADSTRTFRVSGISLPLVWLTTCACGLSTEYIVTVAPCRERPTSSETASVVSDPSYTPFPASSTAAR